MAGLTKALMCFNLGINAEIRKSPATCRAFSAWLIDMQSTKRLQDAGAEARLIEAPPETNCEVMAVCVQPIGM
jgi:hypothetical protein